MPYFNDPVAEIIDIYAYQQRRDRLLAQAQSITPDQARLVSSYARHTPWISPGVNLGLSRAGIPPTDPRVASISATSLAQDPRFKFSATQWGQPISAAQLLPGQTSRQPKPPRLTKEEKQQLKQLRDLGWDTLDRIVKDHPDLVPELRRASSIIQGGIIRKPTDEDTPEGRKFEVLKNAFLDRDIDLPFIEEDRLGVVRGYSGDPDDPMSIAHSDGKVSYLDEPPPTSGGGAFASSFNFSIPTPAGRIAPPPRPDPAMQEKLAAAGIAVDPANPLAPTSFIVRPGLVALNAPVQELQGQFRNVISAVHGRPTNWTESQSDFGIAAGAMMRGQSFDTGSGFFINPESDLARERRIREAKRGQIGGHSITVGRFLADQVTEPDTVPFNVLAGTVDAGVQLADPSSFALGKIGKVRQARSLFEAYDATEEAAGLVSGLRRAIHGPTAAQWLNGKEGTKAIEALVGETSPAKIWVAMGRRTTPQTAARFADASNPQEVRAILEELLGPHIRSPAELEAAAKTLGSGISPLDSHVSALNPRHSRSRMFNWMPGPSLDTQDTRQFATHLERHLVNAKVPTPVIEEVLNDVARADSPNGLFNAATKAMAHEEGVLVQHGISKEHARTLTTLFRDDYGTQVTMLTDEIGDDVPVWTKILDNGDEVEVPGPHLPLEHIGRYIPLPEPRRIRRLTANPALRFLTTTKSPSAFGQNRLPIAAMDFLTQELWKTGTLLGRFPAWISRVVGESQLRMATAGRDSLFRHPIDFFGQVIGRKLTTDPLAEDWTNIEDFQNSLTKAHGGWLSRPGTVRSARPIVIPKVEEHASQFLNAWGDELSLLSYDPLARHVLQNGIDETERWLMVGKEGKKILKSLREAHPGSLLDRDSIQAYLQSISRRITIKTGGNTTLIDALRAGTLGDIPLTVSTNRTNPKFIRALNDHLDSAPNTIKGYELDIRNTGISFPERWNKTIDWMFAKTMGFADNLWDRAPTFKQYTWQHTRELLPYASSDAQALILANARKANLPSRLMKGLEKSARRATEDGLSAEELTFLARGYAADSSKKLLYDLAERGQLADAARIIAPFGAAYQEIFGAWNNLLTELGGPGVAGKLIGAAKVLRRSQQFIEGARGEDFGSVMGAPAGEGFFFKDEFGEEVFVMPGSQWMTAGLTSASGGPSVPTPMTGRVQGLNMIGNIIPGLGPAAAIPVSWMIQDKPALNSLHDLLLPYGAPGERNESDIFQLLNYAPPWVRRAFDSVTNGGYDQRLWANAQKDAQTYLYSTGEYDLTTRAGMQQLLGDAKGAARDLYRIRAFAQVFSPTTPSFRFLIEDKTGNRLALATLVEDYYTLQQADYETAAQTFMEMYGENAVLAIIPKSGSTTYGIPRNQDQLNFVLNNPKLKSNFPSTYGFFLPQSDDFDYEVYLRSFTTGEREDLTPQQWINLANSLRGDMMYRKYQDKVGDRTDAPARQYLADVRNKIMELFPTGPTGLPEKPDRDEMILELYKAAQDKTALSTDAGQGLALYLQYRDKAQLAAESLGRTSFNQSQDTAQIRVWLNEVGAKVMERHPDFQFLWDVVFSRETKTD